MSAQHVRMCPVMADNARCVTVGGTSTHHDRGRAGDCRCGVKCQCELVRAVCADALAIARHESQAVLAGQRDAEIRADERAKMRDEVWNEVFEPGAFTRHEAQVRAQIGADIEAAHGGVMCYHAPAADLSYVVCTHKQDAAIARGES